MTVRESAFHQVTAWLENGREGAEPIPPEGLHPLAVEEWSAGATAARKDFDDYDAAWQGVEDFIVYCVKASILLAILGVVFWWHNPWGLIGGGITTAILLWRWL